MSPFVMHLAAVASGVEFESIVTTETAFSTSVDIDLPASLNGKLCVIIARSAQNPVVLDTPAGWTKLLNTSTFGQMALYYRVCDGSEGATVTINQTSDGSTPTNGRISAIAMRVGGVATGEASFIEAEQDSLSKDPPSLTPSWGSAENAWLAVYASRYANWVVTSYPTDYEELATVFHSDSSDVNYAGIVVGERTLDASSQNPGAFSVTGTTSGERTFTVALRPA